MAAEVKD